MRSGEPAAVVVRPVSFQATSDRNRRPPRESEAGNTLSDLVRHFGGTLEPTLAGGGKRCVIIHWPAYPTAWRWKVRSWWCTDSQLRWVWHRPVHVSLGYGPAKRLPLFASRLEPGCVCEIFPKIFRADFRWGRTKK